MKNTWIAVAGFLILSGSAWVSAQETATPTDVPMVKGDVNETDKVEVNRAVLHENDLNIQKNRQDWAKDTQKWTDDTALLKDAQTRSDDQVTAKSRADVDSDKQAIDKDRDRLEAALSEKIVNDRIIVRKYDEKIRNTRVEIDRDSKKSLDDTAKLVDAQDRNAADEIEKRKTDVENDKQAVNADTTRLNQRLAGKAECVTELKADRRRLDRVKKNLAEDDDNSANAENEDQDTASK